LNLNPKTGAKGDLVRCDLLQQGYQKECHCYNDYIVVLIVVITYSRNIILICKIIASENYYYY
jgi:hypothetical protein